MATRTAPWHPAGRHISSLALGSRWLADANRGADEVFERWEMRQLAPIRIGTRFDLVRVLDLRLGRSAVQDMQQAGVPIGPVLLNHAHRALEFLVTMSADHGWSVEGTELIRRPSPGAAARAVPMPAPGGGRIGSREWLIPPNGSQILTEPRHLDTALRRARTTAPAPVRSHHLNFRPGRPERARAGTAPAHFISPGWAGAPRG